MTALTAFWLWMAILLAWCSGVGMGFGNGEHVNGATVLLGVAVVCGLLAMVLP
jgi:hypothetical protein